MIMLAIASLLVKSTLVLAAAAAATLLMRRRSAAARHVAWGVALTSTLVLPLLSAIEPAWRVRLPALPTRPDALAQAMAPASSNVSTAAVSAEPMTASIAAAFGSRVPASGPAGKATTVDLQPVARHSFAAIVRRYSLAKLAQLAVLAWIVGAALLVARMLLGMLAMARIARRSTLVGDDPRLRDALADVLRRCAVHDVKLRLSPAIDLPATWGFARRIVLLPTEAAEWTSDRWAVVLEHELAHVERRDVWMHLVACLARAVHWINPLAWYAERELRLESEQACDDAVLAGGVRATVYAEQLLDIARPFGARPAARLAPGFAARHIERRLSALLDARVPRRARSRIDAALIPVGVAVLALPLAAMRPAGAGERQPTAHAMSRAAEAFLSQRVSRGMGPGSVHTVRDAAVAEARASGPRASDASTIAVQQPEACVPDDEASSDMSSDKDGVRHWEVHWTGRDCAVDLRAEGKIDFSDNLDDVRAITPGGWLDVSVRRGDHLRRLVVRPRDDGSLDRRLTMDGAPQPWDEAARQWLGGLLRDVDRRTAFAVDTRLPRLLAQGGPNAVLDEVGRMTGDYARGVYLQRLMMAAPLDRAQVRRVIGVAGSEMKSDYEIAQVLTTVANRYGLPDAETRKAFLDAVNVIHSDYEHNRTLHALLDRSQPSEAEAGAILASASTLRSDYELSRTLVDLVSRRLVTPPLFDTYLADAARLQSDYERSRSLRALAGGGRLSDAQVAKVIAAAAGIQSDYEKANVLTTVAGEYDLEGDLRSAYERAARSIQSDYERGRTLDAERKAKAS